jgi:TRAP-type mannitol/chloroaromatic compound transport system permease small subunit
MMYGTLFMMAGAYTLAKNGHVRGDVLYGFFRPRTQATLDLILYFLFFLPGVMALTWAGWNFANESLPSANSTFSATPLPLYPFKFIIPLSGGMLLLQGMVEIVRCVMCIRDGEWPSREQDVEEVDVDKLKAMVHVKDEDIAALDKYIAARGSPVKIRKELWFGFILMALIIAGTAVMLLMRPPHHQRPPGPDDAGAGGGGHHAGLSHGLHADGHGHDLHLARLQGRHTKTLDLMVQSPSR